MTFLINSVVFSQVKTPALSPKSELTQIVGFTEMKIEFSRPSMRGRKIMGNLVNYGDIWRTGANSNTKLTISDDVMFGENILSAGTYSILTRRGIKMWEVFFYRKSDNWALPKVWDINQIAVVSESPSTKINETVESFSIQVENSENNTRFVRSSNTAHILAQLSKFQYLFTYSV